MFHIFPAAEEPIDVPLLRQQQIRLGLLKAARVLFSQQENLRQIMARPASSEGDQFSLFQQLLSAATRPSPIKVMFNRDELEVSDRKGIYMYAIFSLPVLKILLVSMLFSSKACRPCHIVKILIYSLLLYTYLNGVLIFFYTYLT